MENKYFIREGRRFHLWEVHKDPISGQESYMYDLGTGMDSKWVQEQVPE